MRKINTTLIALFVMTVSTGAAGAEEPWWLDQHRLLQTNLREIDATMDLDNYIQDIKDFGADVVLYNVGGIVANYPTDLEFQWQNTFMTGDMTGEVVKRLHKEGLRVIGRFDFSKLNENLAAQHPEWLYVGEDGNTVNYNGQVHTCVSGGYQQEYMFKILGEAIDRYPLDGVFFNAIGYQRRDYSGNQHGLCQCGACKRLFKEYSGLELPSTAKDGDPTYEKYMEFTRMMTARQFQRVHDFLKGKRPDLAICTYTDTGIDIIRKESNHATPDWLYTDSHRAKLALLDYPDKMLSNSAVHFMRIQNRHAGTPPYLTARRLLQHAANGTWLDFYCIGPIHRLEDKTVIPILSDIFKFHARNEAWLQKADSAAEVAMLRSGGEEYEGLFQLLSENQLAFDLVSLPGSSLDPYKLLVVPNGANLNAAARAKVDEFVSNGGKVLFSGQVPGDLQCAGVSGLKTTYPQERGMYLRLRPEDKAALDRPELDAVDLALLDGDLREYTLKDGAQDLLRYVPVGMYGPPEKCYYTTKSDAPGLIHNPYGKGAAVTFPWTIGEHYRRYCHPAHAALFMGAVEGVLEFTPRVQVDASPLVEITLRKDPGGRFESVCLLNHTGQSGIAVHPPIPMTDIPMRIEAAGPVKAVRSLQTGKDLDYSMEGGWMKCAVPRLELYEIVLVEYGS